MSAPVASALYLAEHRVLSDEQRTSAIWFYLCRDFIGVAACLMIAGLALYVLLR
ncbi:MULTISPECIES: hypothetical protein [unclassified Mesorhizobium]|uniref:hypothetical protein n=1 Tax=unclassified Mesorhizobium TaxID=325217 RepID=UPI00142EB189|nr:MULTISPECIES: hypothetical protein [unclassified Mesorhizobium]